MILGFGEIMMRVCPPGFGRFRQCLPGSVDVTFGGGEANVCGSLALLGRPVRYLTALPEHAMADALIGWQRNLGIDTSCILRREGRLGIYFLETGANQRSSTVIYDRAGSSVALAGPDEYDFDAALDGVTRVHVTGITPAISENGFLATRELLTRAAKRGVKISCDLNFRKKLWKWRDGTAPKDLARECMTQLLPMIDVVIGNEADAEDVLGIQAEGTAVEEGQINAEAYAEVARKISTQFANVSLVAITLRESLSASHNNWGAMLFDAKKNEPHFAPLNAKGEYQPFEIRNIVDRVGGGDSFAAGLLYALDSEDYGQPQDAIRFAVAASCLKHSLPGDMNFVTLGEVEALAGGQTSGRVQR